MFAPVIKEIPAGLPLSHHERRPGKETNIDRTERPVVKSAATPLWLPIPDHDQDGDRPEGRLPNEAEDDNPDRDIPLHKARP